MIRHCFKGYCCKSDISSINGRAVEITPTVPLILYYKNKYILPLKQIWEQQYLQQAGSRAPHQPRYSRIIRQDNINLVLNTLSSKWEKKLRKLKIHTLSPPSPPPHYCTFHSKEYLSPSQQNNKFVSVLCKTVSTDWTSLLGYLYS